MLLINAPERLSARQMCEAISIDLDSNTILEDDVIDEQELLRSCGSLVRMFRDNIEFAHFSVQEYLQSDCLAHPTLSTYGLSKERTSNLLGPLCLRVLTLKNRERLPEATLSEMVLISQRRKQHPFYEYALLNWTCWLSDSPNCSIKHLFELFCLRKTASFCTWAANSIAHCLLFFFFFFDIWRMKK